MTWFGDYCEAAAETDQLVPGPRHTHLLVAGLVGEVGSVLAEVKKQGREPDAYPAYRGRLAEELGDMLWYLARLCFPFGPPWPASVRSSPQPEGVGYDDRMAHAIALGSTAGELLRTVDRDEEIALDDLMRALSALDRMAVSAGASLEEIAGQNLDKIRSRWPRDRKFLPLFDDDFALEEQLPRELQVEFKQIERRGESSLILLRCNGLTLGDRISDNIANPDFYRFHDVFHFSYAVYLGWSPVTRSVFRCKRKSDPHLDENEDGARAGIIEEAVSAIVFGRAKEMNFYEGIEQVDYDLLKVVQELVRGFEVDRVPLWQWEQAILEGYRVFRALRDNGGGSVTLDLARRDLRYRKAALCA